MKLRNNKYKNIIRAANKFKPFDFGFLLEIEEQALIYMRDYFRTSKIAVGNERNAELISLAIKLLHIATEQDSSLNISGLNEYEYLKYVNNKNTKRYNKYFK